MARSSEFRMVRRLLKLGNKVLRPLQSVVRRQCFLYPPQFSVFVERLEELVGYVFQFPNASVK